MKQLQVTIEPLSPLAIGRKKPGGSVSEAADHIPGSVIRGAIAAKILDLSGTEGDLTTTGGDFSTLFLTSDRAIFHHGYPQGNLLPLTAFSSKTDSGFLPKGNGVFDTLIDRFCADSYQLPYDPSCPKDGGRVEPYSGFYTHKKPYHTASSSKRLLTRVGINRSRCTAEEELLYSIEVLEELSPYYSTILLDHPPLAQSLTEFLNHHSFRFGGAVSRGLGKVKLTATLKDWQSNVTNKLDQFNRSLRQRWKDWSVFANPPVSLNPNQTFFTINLQSEAILRDHWLRTTVISPSILQKATKVTDPSLSLITAYSSYDYHSGWNSAWGLMKDVELITNKGSVYLFSTEAKSLWLSALAELEVTGIGARTAEGFGQVIICHPFHSTFWENAL